MNMDLAYIDPGSGSILLQVLLASCVGGMAIFWSKIKALFGRRKPEVHGEANGKKLPKSE